MTPPWTALCYMLMPHWSTYNASDYYCSITTTIIVLISPVSGLILLVLLLYFLCYYSYHYEYHSCINILTVMIRITVRISLHVLHRSLHSCRYYYLYSSSYHSGSFTSLILSRGPTCIVDRVSSGCLQWLLELEHSLRLNRLLVLVLHTMSKL